MKILLEIGDLELSQLEICAEQGESRRVWIHNTSGLCDNPDSPQYSIRGQMWLEPLVTLTGGYIPIHGAISLDLSRSSKNKYHFSSWYNAYLERLSLHMDHEVWLRLFNFHSN